MSDAEDRKEARAVLKRLKDIPKNKLTVTQRANKTEAKSILSGRDTEQETYRPTTRNKKEGGKVMHKKRSEKKAPKRPTGRLGSSKIKQGIKEAAEKYPLKKMDRKTLEFLGASTPPKSTKGKTRAEKQRAIKRRAIHEPRSAAKSPEEYDREQQKIAKEKGIYAADLYKPFKKKSTSGAGRAFARRAKGGQVGSNQTDGNKLVASLYD